MSGCLRRVETLVNWRFSCTFSVCIIGDKIWMKRISHLDERLRLITLRSKLDVEDIC